MFEGTSDKPGPLAEPEAELKIKRKNICTAYQNANVEWAKCTYSLVAHNCQVWQSIFIDQLKALSED